MLKSLEIVNKLLEKINQYDDWFLTEVEAEQIKADLDILEILRKYFPKNCHPLICDRKELEKWNKAKQWLEENENDR